MKLLLLFVLASVTFGQSIEERVKKFEDSKLYTVKFDKFEETTRVSVDPSINANSSLILFIPSSGEARFYWWFGRDRSGGYFNRPTLKLLVDGKPMRFENDDIDRTVIFDVPLRDLETLANAKTVEYQVLPYEGEMKFLKAFRNLHSLTKSPPSQSPK